LIGPQKKRQAWLGGKLSARSVMLFELTLGKPSRLMGAPVALTELGEATQ
jgi:hypothetical protein